MALDYTMMRDAANMAAMNRLSRAQSVGESMGTLGFLGADKFRQQGGLGGLLNMFKGRQNPFTQESIEDPNRVYETPVDVLPKDIPMNERVSYEVDGVGLQEPDMSILGKVPTFEAKQGLLNSISNVNKKTTGARGVAGTTESRDYIQGTPIDKAMDEIYAPKQVISSEPTGAAAGGSIGSVNPDGSFEYIYPDGRMEVLQPGQQPGVGQGDFMNTGQPQNNPILNAVGTEFGMTDEDLLNETLDLFWNTNASGTPMPGDFPTPSWTGGY